MAILKLCESRLYENLQLLSRIPVYTGESFDQSDDILDSTILTDKTQKFIFIVENVLWYFGYSKNSKLYIYNYTYI
jgi:hypothetical protein